MSFAAYHSPTCAGFWGILPAAVRFTYRIVTNIYVGARAVGNVCCQMVVKYGASPIPHIWIRRGWASRLPSLIRSLGFAVAQPLPIL